MPTPTPPNVFHYSRDALDVSRSIASGIKPFGEYCYDALVNEAFTRLSERHNGTPIGVVVSSVRTDVLRSITCFNHRTKTQRIQPCPEVNQENGLPVEPDHCGQDDPVFEYIDNMDQLDSRIAATRLTQREDEVIGSWRNGAETCSAIAEELGVSKGSVFSHRSNALRKLRQEVA